MATPGENRRRDTFSVLAGLHEATTGRGENGDNRDNRVAKTGDFTPHPESILGPMKEDLKAVAKAIEAARLRLVELKNKCRDNAKWQDVIEEIEMGLEWIAKNLKKLEATK